MISYLVQLPQLKVAHHIFAVKVEVEHRLEHVDEARPLFGWQLGVERDQQRALPRRRR